MTTPKRTYDVLGIGNAIVDVIASATDDQVAKSGIAKGGMALINEQQADDLYAQMSAARESSGGSSANSMAILASLGGTSAFIGKVADDQLSAIFTHDIQAAGVHFSTPPLSGAAGTARCLIMVTSDAERTMGTYLGACAELSDKDLDKNLIAQSSIILLEGYLFDKPQGQKAFYEAARIAREAGTKVALTLSDAKCVERHHAAFTDFAEKHVDILFANEKERAAFAKGANFGKVAQKVQRGDMILVATLGGKGAAVIKGDQLISIPPAKIEKLVDTTGAGDAFAGGFLYGLTQKKSLEECGNLATFAAGQIISQVGARPLRPLKDTLAEQQTARTAAPKSRPPRP